LSPFALHVLLGSEETTTSSSSNIVRFNVTVEDFDSYYSWKLLIDASAPLRFGLEFG
jgi:hypothetical protein